MRSSVKHAKKMTNIVVPVYADWATIKQNIGSLVKFYEDNPSVEVYYVNDCGPRADYIEKKIIKNIKNIKNFHYLRNEKNLGFVKNCNNAVNNLVIDKTADILLLNSDTVVTKGFVEEMQGILYSQKNICAVNPRSNNATVWSIPTDSSMARRPQSSFMLWQKLKGELPDKYIAPTSHGFCMLIRRDVIDKIGLFDEVYGRGYGEENDFTMRARKDGWVCAVANHAFVFHYGSKSFGVKKQKSFSSTNSMILLNRYPEYNNLVAHYVSEHPEPTSLANRNRFSESLQLPVRIIKYGQTNGYKNLLKRLYSISLNHLSFRDPVIQVWSHEITRSGAPLVLIDLITQWQAEKDFPNNITFNVPFGAAMDQGLMRELDAIGIHFNTVRKSEVYLGKNDSIILNSTAQPEWLYRKIICQLQSGTLRKLYYYIHEDDEYTTRATTNYRDALSKLISDNKIIVYTPSSASNKKWRKYFNVTKNIFSMPGHITYHKDMFKPISGNKFDKIKFVVAGSREPRKGIPDILHALQAVERFYIQKNPHKYRDFTLTIVGDDHNNDFHNRFISGAASHFGNRVILKGNTAHDKLYEIMKESNFTITYSMADSLSMVTFEGMAFGHPIIRSEASGMEEQLVVGKNGWMARTSDWSELVDALEEVLNKDSTSNNLLSRMSRESINIAKQNYDSQYRILDDIRGDLV